MDKRSLSAAEIRERVKKYLVQVRLPQETADVFYELKKKFAFYYGSYASRHSDPHISVLKITLPNTQELELKELVSESLSGISEFEIGINSLSTFPESGTIYYKIYDEGKLSIARERIVDSLISSSLKFRKPFREIYNPHLTIARELDPVGMSQAVEFLKDFPVDLHFNCRSISILKQTRQFTELIAEIPLSPGKN
jgi:2'-5' RNA ligase